MSEMSKRYAQYCKELELEKDKLKKAKLHVIVNAFAKFKTGDIIDNGECRIKVKRITPSLLFGVVEIVYIGVKLTKENKPFKNGVEDSIHTDENHKYVKLIKVD